MISDTRLAEIVSALEHVGASCLVMGGHAVRFYGLERNTNDVDVQIAPGQWEQLPDLLARAKLTVGQTAEEGPTWRGDSFRRFCIGTLPDGREEWLEFWKENHLLPPHSELLTRAESGLYRGREIKFLGLDDLIRSKETERDADWQDIATLEQFLDSRLLSQVRSGAVSIGDALKQLRSQTGFLSYLEAGELTPDNAAMVLARASNPVTQAFLLPFAPDAPRATAVTPIEPVIVGRLQTTTPAAPLHLALVEIVRRRYIAFRKELDRRDKEAIRAQQQ